MGTVRLDFVVAGAPKAATTSLIDALRAHPEVFVPPRKELSFFDGDHYSDDLGEYSGHFADALPEQQAGEGTPWYMSSPRAPERLAAHFPGLRIFFVLREPLARARSHYLHRVSRHAEYRTFAETLSDELEELEKGEYVHRRGYLIQPGLYATHLKKWGEHFPSSQLKVILFEDLIGDPASTLREIQAHLGVTEHALELPAANQTWGVRAESLARVTSKLIRSDSRAKRIVQWVTPQSWRSWIRRTVSRLNQSSHRPRPLHATAAEVARMREWFDPEVEQLSRILSRPLEDWSSSAQ